jgi:hypothetical protein
VFLTCFLILNTSIKSSITILSKGKVVNAISIEITSKYPSYHPNAFSVLPIINCPIALPKLPVPSIIPVIVEVALLLFFRDYYFPKSAEQDADKILQRPLSKKPKKNQAK